MKPKREKEGLTNKGCYCEPKDGTERRRDFDSAHHRHVVAFDTEWQRPSYSSDKDDQCRASTAHMSTRTHRPRHKYIILPKCPLKLASSKKAGRAQWPLKMPDVGNSVPREKSTYYIPLSQKGEV